MHSRHLLGAVQYYGVVGLARDTQSQYCTDARPPTLDIHLGHTTRKLSLRAPCKGPEDLRLTSDLPSAEHSTTTPTAGSYLVMIKCMPQHPHQVRMHASTLTCRKYTYVPVSSHALSTRAGSWCIHACTPPTWHPCMRDTRHIYIRVHHNGTPQNHGPRRYALHPIAGHLPFEHTKTNVQHLQS